MRTPLVLLAALVALPSFGQDSLSVVSDSTSGAVSSATLSELELARLDERLAQLDSAHLLFTTAAIPRRIPPMLCLSDSIFKYYMAELDARTPFEMTYNPVVKRTSNGTYGGITRLSK